MKKILDILLKIILWILSIFFILWGLISLSDSTDYFSNLLIIFGGIWLIPVVISKLHTKIKDRVTIKKSKFILWYSISIFIILFIWFAVSWNNTQVDKGINNELIIELENESEAGEVIEENNQEVILEEEQQSDIRIESSQKVSSIPLYTVSKVIDWDTVYMMKNGEELRLRLIWIDTPENTTLRYWYTECYWEESADYLKKLLSTQEIEIEYDDTQGETDKYGRHLVYVFHDGVNVNNHMIRQGYGFEYTYNTKYKYSDLFKKSEIDAKSEGVWLWSKDTCSGNRVSEIKESTEISKSVDDSIIVWDNVSVKKIFTPIEESESRELIIKMEDIEDKIVEEVPVVECLIKGNISSSEEKIYHYPWCQSYKQTKISPSKWEKWFCSEEEAKNAGWRVAGNCY